MANMIFSQASIFHLQKLAHHVHTSTGVRHRLADENSMMKLLKSATLSYNDDVQQDLQAFMRDLDEKQVNALMSRGVILRKTG